MTESMTKQVYFQSLKLQSVKLDNTLLIILCKFINRRSVEALWRLAEAQKMEFDDDLLDKVS